jgi:alginate O-acetyltransferase complex protein AlgI
LKLTSQAAPAASTWEASWLGWFPFILLPALAIWFRDQMPAWFFMWSLAFAIFAGLKWITWWKARNRIPHSVGRSVAYLAAWPGMDAEAFLDSRKDVHAPQFREWMWALAKTLFGAVLLWKIARIVPESQPLVRGWVGLVGLVCLLHFGGFHLIALFWQALGIDAEPIMSKPILSKTLSEFWGKRWNLGFRQLAYDLIFQPLHRKTGVAVASLLVFLASGLIHDLVISVPARGGYGLPTAYFILQGLGVTLERSPLGRRLQLQRGLSAWLFMFVVAAVPAFWLFHPPFVTRVILPFMHAIHAL